MNIPIIQYNYLSGDHHSFRQHVMCPLVAHSDVPLFADLVTVCLKQQTVSVLIRLQV